MSPDDIRLWVRAMHIAIDEIAYEQATVFLIDELPEHGFLMDCPDAVQ